VSEQLELWVQRLSNGNMPVFAHTVQTIAATAGRDDSSYSELAWSILQDPGLTAQVLKLSNSIYYNPSSRRINTVSRALMRLGFETVKEMCLSIALVESVLSNLHREKVALEIARAFHSAVQAKKIATLRQLATPEEVFIAALLSRIGQIAFWCFAGESGERLELAMSEPNQAEGQAEMEVLGFRLEWLTLRLSQEWKLSDLLESALRKGKSVNPDTECISLGYLIAQCAETGWESPATKRVIKRIGGFLNIPEQEAAQCVFDAARDAAAVTESYGAGVSSRLIPLPEEIPAATAETESGKKEYPKPDHYIQLCSLRDLSSLLAGKTGDINMVLSVLLEGIYRGIGMDRVIFALLSPDRQFLQGKYGLGWSNEKYVENFRIGIDPGKPNIFGHVLQCQKPIWVTEEPTEKIMSLLTKEMAGMIGRGPFFVMHMSIKSRAIGVIYADRNLSGRELDEESFDSFVFFGQQANMGVTTLAGAM
jgi:HD-like signal output (HDOD) protein